MSWFFGFLKHAFGFGDEERKEIPRNRSQSDHDYQSTFPQTTSSSIAQKHHCENSLRSFSYPNREIDNYSVPNRNVVRRTSDSVADFANCNKNSVVRSVSALPTSQKAVLPTSQKAESVGVESKSQNKNLLLESEIKKLVSSLEKDLLPFSLSSKPSPTKPTSSLAPSQPPSVSALPTSKKAVLPTSQKAKSVGKESKTQNKNLFESSSETKKPVSFLENDQLPFSPSLSKPPSTKPTLSLAPSSSTSQKEKTSYFWLEKGTPSTYLFPDDIKSSIEKGIVPGVLQMPLSMSTYKDYFHALLYAEDYYLEKWDGFEMKNVTLKLHEAEIYMRKGNPKKFNVADEKEEKIFVAFEIDKIPERRPFLLSRDFVSVQPSSKKTKAFQGLIYRVVKSNLVLAEFGEDFHSQHRPAREYDVKFSFNRVCLKRAHQAIAAASDLLYRNFLFPGFPPTHDHKRPSSQLFPINTNQKDALSVRQISRLQGAPPYLVEGPISVIERKNLSRTGVVIVEAVVKICRTSPSSRILLCAPLNNTCDVIMRVLKKEIEESDMFRANAAFREVDGVPIDILPSCLYEREMDFFACPSLEELKKYKVILSTYMSSFRLYDKGLKAGHFSHIFLVDNSSVTEPETMVPLANFANSKTVVVVTGTRRNHTGWIRSKIARQNGLMSSYFERLRESLLYKNLDPSVISQLEN